MIVLLHQRQRVLSSQGFLNLTGMSIIWPRNHYAWEQVPLRDAKAIGTVTIPLKSYPSLPSLNSYLCKVTPGQPWGSTGCWEEPRCTFYNSWGFRILSLKCPSPPCNYLLCHQPLCQLNSNTMAFSLLHLLPQGSSPALKFSF